MEGGGFFPSGHPHHASSAASIFILLSLCFNFLKAEDEGGDRGTPTPTHPNNNTGDPHAAVSAADDQPQQRVQVREQDQYMPIANVIRIMRRILPPHGKISDDAKETVQECVSEFISFITSEANQRCRHEQRKTVTAEDLLWAIGRLGFDDYVGPLSLFLARYRDFDGNGNGNRSASASASSAASAVVRGQRLMIAPPHFAPPAPAAPPAPLARQHYGAGYPEGPYPMGGYYMGNGSGSGSSSGSPANYDPYHRY